MSNKFLVRQILKASGSFFVGASITIGILCPIVLSSSRVLADSTYTNDIPTDAANELQTLAKQNINPKTIAFTPNNGGFEILYSSNGNSRAFGFAPQGVSDAFATLYNQNSTINTIAFTPDGEWVIIYNGYGAYWSDNFPQDVKDKIVEINQKKFNIDTIAFTPDGEWVIIYGGNNNTASNGLAYSNNIPQAVVDQLVDIKKQNLNINSVAFAPNGGVVIIYNDGKAAYVNNISQQLHDTIATALNKGETLTSIAFTPSNGWALLYVPSIDEITAKAKGLGDVESAASDINGNFKFLTGL